MSKFYKRIAGVALGITAVTGSALAQDVELYGSVLAPNYGDLSKSLYKLPITNTGDPELTISGVQALSAFIDNGKYYALNNGSGSSSSVKVYDIKSGALVDSWSGNEYQYQCFGIDKDPLTGEYYGVFYDSSQYYVELAIVTFDGATPTRTKTIGRLNEGLPWYGFSINADGDMYGISYDYDYYAAALYKIDRNTAAMTRVGSTGVSPSENGSACFDREANKLYWTTFTSEYYDDLGYLTTISTRTGKATNVYEFDGDAWVAGLAIERASVAEGAPAECENVAVNFADGNLSGNITLVAPSTLVDGTAGTGDLTIKVLANDAEIASVATVWGARVTIPVTLDVTGLYNFTVYALNAEGDGKSVAVDGVFVGMDTPKAPVASLLYEDEKMIVSWEAVTESANGGYVDWSALTYTVTRYPGAVEVASGLTATSFTEDFPETDGIVYYEVIAIAGDYKSLPGKTNEIKMGAILPPFVQSSFSNEILKDYTIIDANKDGNTWTLNEGEVRVKYNSSKAMDDWLITPAFKLEAGNTYKFEVLTHAHTSSYPEKLEVKLGTAPTVEDMTSELIAPTTITTSGNKSLTALIIPTKTGKYYIGFHGISDADQYYLYINEYSIAAGVPFPAPSNLAGVINDADEVSLTWEAPEFTNASALKESDLKGYNVYRDNEKLNAAPVEETAYTDTTAEPQKVYTYYVTAVYDQGDSAKSNEVIPVRTSVSLAGSGINVAVFGNSIVIAGAEGLNINVVAVNGINIYSAVGDSQNVVPAASGVYVVNIAGKICKVIVK